MEQTSTSTFTTAEIVGIATAAATALGGVIVALGRSQDHSARKRVTKRARRTQKRLRNRNISLDQLDLDRGRDLALATTSLLATKYPDIRDTASEWVGRTAESARPQLSRAGSTAGATAEQLRMRGSTVLDRLQESALPAAQSALGDLRERAEGAVEQAQPRTKDAVSVTTAKADAALTKTTSAAQDALATVMWLVAAVSLIYFALLSPERREQVKNMLFATVDQTQLLIRDFQGYDEQV